MPNRSTRRWICVFMLALPLAARPEGKCGDDPVPKEPGGPLYVTWMFPHPPTRAPTGFKPASIFVDIDARMGDPSPPGYSGPVNPAPASLTDGQVFARSEDAASWEKGLLKTDMPSSGKKALDEYVNDRKRKAISGVLVEHPPIPDPTGVSICTCVLQRAVVLYENGAEDLYVRTLFRTKKPGDTRSYSFLPKEAWWFSFDSTTIWFPLRFNKLQTEQSWMVLDILSPKAFQPGVQWGPNFTEGGRGSVTVGNRTYNAVRLYRTFGPRENVTADLDLDPRNVLQP